MKGTVLKIVASIVVCVAAVAFCLPGCTPTTTEITLLKTQLGNDEKAIAGLQTQINNNSNLFSTAIASADKDITDCRTSIDTVDGKVNLTINQSQEAVDKARQALDQTNLAISDSGQALDKAKKASDQSSSAIGSANEALTKVKQTLANQTDIAGLKSRINNEEDRINNLVQQTILEPQQTSVLGLAWKNISQETSWKLVTDKCSSRKTGPTSIVGPAEREQDQICAYDFRGPNRSNFETGKVLVLATVIVRVRPVGIIYNDMLFFKLDTGGKLSGDASDSEQNAQVATIAGMSPDVTAESAGQQVIVNIYPERVWPLSESEFNSLKSVSTYTK